MRCDASAALAIMPVIRMAAFHSMVCETCSGGCVTVCDCVYLARSEPPLNGTGTYGGEYCKRVNVNMETHT